MSSTWFTESGCEGELNLTRNGDSWFVKDTSHSNPVIVSLPDSTELSEKSGAVEISATVVSFAYEQNNKHDRLYLKDVAITASPDINQSTETTETDQSSQGEDVGKPVEETGQTTPSPSASNPQQFNHHTTDTTGNRARNSSSGQVKKSTNSTPGDATKNATGTITNYVSDRGYGFITTTDIGRRRSDGSRAPEDIFFHISDIPTQDVKEGWRLQFDIEMSDDGFEAKNIRVLEREKNYEGADNSHRKPDQPKNDEAIGPMTTRGDRTDDGPKKPPDRERWR